MRAEVVIESEYEATWCELKGLTCRMEPSPEGHGMEYIFSDSKALKEARRQFKQDVDLQEFIEAHRRLTWATKRANRSK